MREMLNWLGYDRRFRQTVAANPHMQWSKTDTYLWHLAFTGMVKRPRYVHCLSLTHKSSQCNWAQDTQEMLSSPKFGSWYCSQVDPKHQSSSICRSRNRDPRSGCSFPSYKFQHICTFCSRNPTSTDKSHTRLCFVLTVVPEHLAQMLAAFLLQVNGESLAWH